MSSETTENPVMLWGDMGPDVYKLSQIYDPRNDKYVATQDTSVREGKDYYERRSLILTSDENVHTGRKYYTRNVDADGKVSFVYIDNISEKIHEIDPSKNIYTFNPSQNDWYQDSGGKIIVFSKVTTFPPRSNPLANKWYEVNEDSVDTCGKYIPAVDSLVVVDEVECYYKTENNYKTRMLLTVKSVDEAFNVTFATVVFGSETEETVRAIDYGNEKFMLFFDRKGTGVVTYVPATTEELHDDNITKYVKNVDGSYTAVTTLDQEDVTYYVRKSSGSQVLLTPDRKLLLYGKNTYGYRIKRQGVVISSNIPAIQTGDDAFIPYARAIAKRVKITAENYDTLQSTGRYFDVILPNGLQRIMQLPADPTKLIRTCDTVVQGNTYYYKADGTRVSTFDINPWVGRLVIDYENAKGYYLYRPIAKDANNVSKPWSGDLLNRVAYMYDDPAAASGNVFLPERCFLKSNLSIVDGEPLLMEIFMFGHEEVSEDGTTSRIVNTNVAQLCMSLTIIAKEATALDSSDITTRQIVKFDVELNGSDTQGDIWYLQQGDDWRSAFDVVPKISFDDGSDLTVPVDGKTCYMYGFEDIKSKLVGSEYQVLFKFFPHKSLNIDWQKVGLTPTKNFITCRKTVKIINNLAYRIRKISLIPAWNQAAQEYELYYMIFRNDYVSPPVIKSGLSTKYMVSTYQPTEDVYVQADKNYYYKTNSGQFLKATVHTGDSIATIQASLGTIFENVMQPKTSIQQVSYLNDNDAVSYVGATASGSLFDVVQRAILAERVYVDGINASSVYTQPIAFKLQNMMIKSEPVKWLIGDDATGYTDETLHYGSRNAYTPEGIIENALNRPYLVYSDGTYRVDRASFSLETFMQAFWTNARPPSGTFGEENQDTVEFQPTHFFIRAINDESACSEMIPLTEEDYTKAVTMEGGGTATSTIGGAIPVKTSDDIYGQVEVNLMGTVIVEFVHQYPDPENPTKYLYKHLYAVPVETRDTAWEA